LLFRMKIMFLFCTSVRLMDLSIAYWELSMSIWTYQPGSVAFFNNYLWSIKRAARRFFCYAEDNYRLLSACIF